MVEILSSTSASACSKLAQAVVSNVPYLRKSEIEAHGFWNAVITHFKHRSRVARPASTRPATSMSVIACLDFQVYADDS